MMELWKSLKRTISLDGRSKVDTSSAVAVIDASTIYGASRYWRSVHNDPTWEFASRYRAAEDRLLFEEFLHNIMIYSVILLDNSSCGIDGEISRELRDIIDFINFRLGFNLITPRPIAPDITMRHVVDIVCNLLSKGCQDQRTRDLLLSISVPWYYKEESHYDRPAFEKSAKEWGLSLDMLPIAIFLYRGLCYSGYTNFYVQNHKTPAVYLASPGRMNVLSPLISAEAMQLFKYPHQAYSDLVELLHLPENGYNFSHLPLLSPANTSNLTNKIYEKPPDEALDFVLKLRSSKEACKMRELWASRIWSSKSSCAVGIERSNTINNSTIYGNVNMVIHAAAAS